MRKVRLNLDIERQIKIKASKENEHILRRGTITLDRTAYDGMISYWDEFLTDMTIHEPFDPKTGNYIILKPTKLRSYVVYRDHIVDAVDIKEVVPDELFKW